MWNRNLSPHRYALAVGSALAVSLLIVIASLVSATAHVPVYLG